MVEIIRLHDDPHEQTQRVLPWYVNGTLQADEAAAVEAHLAECEECRADLDAEMSLARRIASLSQDADRGWTALRDRLEARAAPRRLGLWRSAGAVLQRPVPVGWAMVALAASFAVVATLFWTTDWRSGATYHALSATPASSEANVIVIFKPTTTERALRQALVRSRARLVDGPTATDAYVLHVAPEQRSAALAELGADPNVRMVEPIDGEAR